MALNEVIRTTGDIRRTLAQTMSDIRTGEIPVQKAMAIAALAKEITSSMQTEVNIAKAKFALGENGKALGDITHLGKMLIEDGDVPTLSGS
jgi:hypothetical protein